MLFRLCFILMLVWLAYMAARAIYRVVRRSMGLPVEEPGPEQRLFRQAVLGTLPSALVPSTNGACNARECCSTRR